MYIQHMNEELNDDIKKKFMLPLTIELQDHEENVFRNAPVSPVKNLQFELNETTIEIRSLKFDKIVPR